ncbi:hypothetical protein B9G53_26200 [Pseudanabaena sp. SR411]|uniref:hypothetical protein n=1 Tax=Pseudanabaena sp. SR411 TaxID=1980935 RepID=UPI000B99C029|nr:hypothetical protein [Pseudanabaena sp. SR411]OYQ61663.1 hypothetical protein B9G53_26200 [Pseudanabaena sp. SR411]
MSYDSPGYVDQLNTNLIDKWNEVIQVSYTSLEADFGSRFFAIDPQALTNPSPAAIQWFADPAEPNFCIGEDVAKQLSDWGIRGRQELHNEYCEYRVIERVDSSGRMRPKRIQVTTELREYWVCIAKYDPTKVREMVQSTLGFQPSWEDLYGVNDPFGLTEDQREISFSTLVAGHGNDRKLSSMGVPRQPTGRLNTENALFMTHPINGLDDLLYIVMFGARPYASSTPGTKATREQIFREFDVEQLACRHADPAAAMGAYEAVFNGQPVAFANPLGMYFLSFTKNVFSYQGSPIPDEWIQWSRGKQEGVYQRLEFGPSDSDAAFLDDITVDVGSSSTPLTGGFQVLQFIEVGPLVVVGDVTPVSTGEYIILNTSNSPIKCSEADVCNVLIKPLKEEYDRNQQVGRVSPRVMGRS